MTKTSTIQFKINNLASKLNGEITDLDSALNPESEFSDVMNYLDKLDLDVDQMVVDKIMALSSQL